MDLKDRLIPELLDFKYALDGSAARTKINIDRSEESTAEIEKILKSDVKSAFRKKTNTLDALINSDFASYEGPKGLSNCIDQAKEPRFAVLFYLGKSNNHLKSPHNCLDLSWMAFLNRLNEFGKRAESIIGRRSLVSVVFENEFFDRSVLQRPASYRRMLAQARSLRKEFGLNNIEFVNMSQMLKRTDRFADRFKELITDPKEISELSESPGFEDSYGPFYYSYPTSSFGEAIEMYTKKKAALAKWAGGTTLRYLALIKARQELGFWKANPEYIGCTVSRKVGAITFKYKMGS